MSIMSSVYAEVIDLLDRGNIDYREIAIKLAKEHPSLFLRLAENKPPVMVRPKQPTGSHQFGGPNSLLALSTFHAIFEKIKVSDRVGAIRELRIGTERTDSLNLKDAKDIIDTVTGDIPMQLDFNPRYVAMVNEIKAYCNSKIMSR